MAIVKMSKFRLFTFDHDREKLLKRLQKFEYVHLNDLREEESLDLQKVERNDELVHVDEQLNKSKWAIDLLRQYERKLGAMEAMKIGQKSLSLDEIRSRAKTFDFDAHYKELYELNSKKESLLQRNGNIDSMIGELTPWRNISLPMKEIHEFPDVKVQTGTIPLRYKESFMEAISSLKLTTATQIEQDKNFAYFVVIMENSEVQAAEEIFRNIGFTPVEVKTKGEVSQEIAALYQEKENNAETIKSLQDKVKWHLSQLENFEITYDYFKNEKLKLLSSEKFLKTDQVDVMEGYVPSDRLESFDHTIAELLGKDYYLVAEDAQRNDPKVPIILKNNAFVAPFESLTEMYSLPRYNEIDPTPLFAPFYFVFAGIMVGDFGYGLLVFMATLFMLKTFNLQPGMRKFIRFFNYLSISTMIWGLIFGSFFGGIIKIPALLDPTEDYVSMILMSLILGGVHLFFGLGIRAYMNIRDGQPKEALYDVGFWYMALVGLIILIVGKATGAVAPMVTKIAVVVMIIGMAGIVATGGRTEKTTAGKIGWGIYALYNITGYIGDFVSYLRLMALALAGAFIAVAVNLISGMLFGSGIVGKLAAVVIFLIFQMFNAFLSYLSAYVHSARLTYVEMFNKFYEGGGVPFKKMVEKSEYFNIKE